MNGSKQYISESNITQNDNKLRILDVSSLDVAHEEKFEQSDVILNAPRNSPRRDGTDDTLSSEGNTNRLADRKEEDEKEKDNSAEMSRLVKDMTSYTYCNTIILDNLDKVNFASDMDRFVFQNLPLTNSQKEELLLSMFTKV
jgi:hypothetical protein